MGDLLARLQSALGAAYRVREELGGGGMGRVFVATETALDRPVVIKVLPPDLAPGLSVERFRREIQLAAKLQHPHIVPLLSAGAVEGLLYYTMPLIEGESLRMRLARQGELPIPEAVRILRDVADALAYAHEHALVHRDIKPDNVLVSGKHALVTDFGVSKALSTATGTSTLTSIGVALGTPAYMAPEQAAADPNTDHRADIYALGVVGYELLTGHPPFAGLTAQQVLAAHATQTPRARNAGPGSRAAGARSARHALSREARSRQTTDGGGGPGGARGDGDAERRRNSDGHSASLQRAGEACPTPARLGDRRGGPARGGYRGHHVDAIARHHGGDGCAPSHAGRAAVPESRRHRRSVLHRWRHRRGHHTVESDFRDWRDRPCQCHRVPEHRQDASADQPGAGSSICAAGYRANRPRPQRRWTGARGAGADPRGGRDQPLGRGVYGELGPGGDLRSPGEDRRAGGAGLERDPARDGA